ncbi:cob(I)yrinic acid a,c-diamide adenosyltransferase [Synechococcus sp. CCY 9618]|uniref:cob(I)yrinic acid a,c-diamide adenosyltransferase n=1 Tax=Synechococcus sp. CCY 9618 TaxID=2815602 RepID=UPI001C231B5E|nr:cob(I)yrinic acid a,c-diamide adenosyltransferase [Synechococcus sp. CCY 9618]
MTASLVDPGHSQRSAAGSRSEGLALVPPLTPPLRLVTQPEGLLQIHTAPFRGSFAAVFSQALRTAGLGSRVLVSQFLKGGVEQGLAGSLWLCGRLQWLRPATPHCLDGPPPVEDEAEDAVRQVWDYSRGRLLAGDLDLLVLDELGLAIALGYLPAAEVIASLEQRPAHLDVILTGPSMPASLMAMADQVTQLRQGR